MATFIGHSVAVYATVTAIGGHRIHRHTRSSAWVRDRSNGERPTVTAIIIAIAGHGDAGDADFGRVTDDTDIATVPV